MASACAIATKADTLVFLTDVPGVKGALMAKSCAGSRSRRSPPSSDPRCVITGGMLPKLNACRDALIHGVKRVRILPAGGGRLLPDLISSRVNDGTEREVP